MITKMGEDVKRWTAKRKAVLVMEIMQGKNTGAVASRSVHRHRFESQQHASRVIGDWIGFYNNQRPHQALGMRTPAEVYALAA